MCGVRGLVACGVIGVGAGLSVGTVVDLSTNESGSINGGVFQRGYVQPAGTGVIRSFLRMHASNTEQGYNTSGRPVAFDELTDPNFTRNIQFGDLSTRTVNGVSYFDFMLDTNEPNAPSNRNISLDQLKVFTSPTGSQTTTNVDSLGTLRYNMDAGANSWVVINDSLSRGSGESDVRILIPTALFAGASAGDYVYLFARFGDHYHTQGGFEEFAIQSSASVVPLPSASLLGVAGMMSLICRIRRRA